MQIRSERSPDGQLSPVPQPLTARQPTTAAAGRGSVNV